MPRYFHLGLFMHYSMDISSIAIILVTQDEKPKLVTFATYLEQFANK